MQTVVAAILLSADKKRILLTQRAGPDFAFFWCHPGGKVDPTDADPIAALCREIKEEIGMVMHHGDYELFDDVAFEPPVCAVPTRLLTYLVPMPALASYQLLDKTIGGGWFTPVEILALNVTPGLMRLRRRLVHEFQPMSLRGNHV